MSSNTALRLPKIETSLSQRVALLGDTAFNPGVQPTRLAALDRLALPVPQGKLRLSDELPRQP